MIVLGLTGSIGMGKSTAAGLFREQGAPVFDADQCVHDLYRGAAIEPVRSRFDVSLRDGGLDRDRLAALVLDDHAAMRDLEAIIHPLVVKARQDFLARAQQSGLSLAVVDVPLLLETGGERAVDAVAVVSAPEAVQKSRVLARPGMTEEKFRSVLRRQMPDAEKRRRAHFLILSDRGIEPARRQIGRIVAILAQGA
jgi:dephospho-CoA kinase